MSGTNLSFIESTIPILLFISGSLGVILCALVFYLMFARNVKGMFNVYIGNLVGVDIIVSLFYIFIGYFWQFYINQQKSDPFYCMIYESMHYNFVRAIVPLAFMPASIHRLCCVLFPLFSHKWFDKVKLSLFCLAVNLIALYFGIVTWFRETAFPHDKAHSMSWCNFSKTNWIGYDGLPWLRAAVDFTEKSILQSNYYPIIWAIILLMNAVTVFLAVRSQKVMVGDNLARVKETFQVALATILQVLVPLMNTAIGYLPNNLYNWYSGNGWVITPDFLQMLYDIAYVGIFLISLNPLCDALMVLLIMPPYRKALKKMAVDKLKGLISLLEDKSTRSGVVSLHPSNVSSRSRTNGLSSDNRRH